MRIGVLVSGRGTNLAALLEAGLPVRLVVSNRAAAPALGIATDHGVQTRVLRRADHGDAEARDAAIGDAFARAGVELVVLAGYDQLLRPSYFARFGGRTINIHPSLLPAHGGAGMMGMAVHRAVLEAADAETGATVHEVTPELDAGPVLAQVRVPVLPDDDAETPGGTRAGPGARAHRPDRSRPHRRPVQEVTRCASAPGGPKAPGHGPC